MPTPSEAASGSFSCLAYRTDHGAGTENPKKRGGESRVSARLTKKARKGKTAIIHQEVLDTPGTCSEIVLLQGKEGRSNTTTQCIHQTNACRSNVYTPHISTYIYLASSISALTSSSSSDSWPNSCSRTGPSCPGAARLAVGACGVLSPPSAASMVLGCRPPSLVVGVEQQSFDYVYAAGLPAISRRDDGGYVCFLSRYGIM